VLNTSINALLISTSIASTAWAQEFIAPPMVNISAGSFNMGSVVGSESAKPMHNVTLAAFQMAKYPVTIAEFKIFAEETGYSPKPTCNDYLGEHWMSGPEDSGTASWDNNRYVFSDYQPVSCISFQDATDYANWLSNKTGHKYRLPTEEEWEYATKANTTSRYFWGDDVNDTQACLYANIADQSGEYFASKQYGASYWGFLEHANCDDGEPYVTLVGMYRPNPFGLYDMLGNMSQYLASCYYPDYNPRTRDEMDVDKCETLAHRGFDWHFPPQPHTDRGRVKKEWTPGADVGFRLAIDGQSNKVEPSTIKFEAALKIAQIHRFETRAKLPKAPKNIQLFQLEKHLNSNNYRLRWQPSDDPRVIGYEVYQSKSPASHLMGLFYKKYYNKLQTVDASTNSFDVTLPEEGGSFRLETVTKDMNSLPSNAAVEVKAKFVSIPGRVNMKNTLALENVRLAYQEAKADKPELYYLSRFYKGFKQDKVTATFNVEVKESAWYRLNYTGSSNKAGKLFELWQGNHLLAEINYDVNIDDKTSQRHKVYLQQGKQQIQLTAMREGFDFWRLGWLDFTEVKN